MNHRRTRRSTSTVAAGAAKRSLLAVLIATAAMGNVDATPLIHQGGPVVSRAEVFMVNWSSDVSAPISAGMPTFYADILASDYWNVLQEYSTATQTIQSQGLFIGSTTLFGTLCGAGTCTLDDSDVRAELALRINTSDPSFPPLSADGSGHATTVLMVHFGPAVTIKVGTAASCVDYTAVHETIQADATQANLVVPIAIVPDCSTTLPVTHSAGAMLADIAADPQPAASPGWTDAAGRSVGDICRGSVATVVAGGHSYAVPPLWSNGSNACITGVEIFADNFEGP